MFPAMSGNASTAKVIAPPVRRRQIVILNLKCFPNALANGCITVKINHMILMYLWYV